MNSAGAARPHRASRSRSGLVLVVFVSITAPISGGLLNPAVAIGLWTTGQDSHPARGGADRRRAAGRRRRRLPPAFPVPLSCSTAGAAASRRSHLGSPRARAILIEAVASFFSIFAVYGTAVDERGPFAKTAGLTIGLVFTFDIMAFGPLTGAAMNPARWLGPAVATNNYANWYVWVVGPIAGGIIAGVVYWYAFLRGHRARHAVGRQTMTADVYLDNASATPMLAVAREAMIAALDRFGDPLNLHGPGREARRSWMGPGRRRRRDRRPARRDRVHIRRHGIGGARDLGRRARGARTGLPHRRERRRASRPSAACATFLRATASRSITIPVDGFGRIDLDRFAARGPPSRHAARERSARQPRTRHDAAGRVRPRAWPARRRSASTSMRARPWGVSPWTWRRSAWTCSHCRGTSSEGRPGWERSTCAAGSA